MSRDMVSEGILPLLMALCRHMVPGHAHDLGDSSCEPTQYLEADGILGTFYSSYRQMSILA